MKKKNENRPGTVKALPQDARPYEKCIRYGTAALSDRELLAVIIRSGIAGQNALELAETVLCAMGNTPYPGLHGLLHASIRDLMKIPGVGKVRAVQLMCVGELSKRISSSEVRQNLNFSNPGSVAGYFMEKLRHEEQENIIVLMLDSKNHPMGEPVLSKGTANAAMITPREIFMEALRFHAVSIILIHNHPSGDPNPSKNDLELTQRVSQAGKLVGILLLDHIVIGDRKYISFREQQLFAFE